MVKNKDDFFLASFFRMRGLVVGIVLVHSTQINDLNFVHCRLTIQCVRLFASVSALYLTDLGALKTSSLIMSEAFNQLKHVFGWVQLPTLRC